jgi:hypothetical protein
MIAASSTTMAQTISALGVGIAKPVFHNVGLDDSGHVVVRKRIARRELLHFIATLPPALIGGAQGWSGVEVPRDVPPRRERPRPS